MAEVKSIIDAKLFGEVADAAGKANVGSSGSISDQQKNAADEARPAMEAAFGAKDGLNSSNEKFKEALIRGLNAAQGAIRAASEGGDAATVSGNVDRVKDYFNEAKSALDGSGSSSGSQQSVATEVQNIKRGLEEFVKFLKSFS